MTVMRRGSSLNRHTHCCFGGKAPGRAGASELTPQAGSAATLGVFPGPVPPGPGSRERTFGGHGVRFPSAPVGGPRPAFTPPYLAGLSWGCGASAAVLGGTCGFHKCLGRRPGLGGELALPSIPSLLAAAKVFLDFG